VNAKARVKRQWANRMNEEHPLIPRQILRRRARGLLSSTTESTPTTSPTGDPATRHDDTKDLPLRSFPAVDTRTSANDGPVDSHPDQMPGAYLATIDVSTVIPETSPSLPARMTCNRTQEPQTPSELPSTEGQSSRIESGHLQPVAAGGSAYVSRAALPPDWKVIEPEDRSDPAPHELYGCESLRNDGWSLMYASLRGKLHAHRGLWRDDAFAWGQTGDWTVMALCDGAGGSRLGRVGARLASEEAKRSLLESLQDYHLLPGEEGATAESDLSRLRAFLEVAALRAKVAVLREAHQRQCSPADMNTTLLLSLHAPVGDSDLVGNIQIGDGAVGIYTGDDNCTLLGIADHGRYSSETRFLTTPHIEYEFAHRVCFTRKKEIRCVAIMCDGVSDDFFPEDRRLLELFIGNPVCELKSKTGGPLLGVMHEVVKDPREGRALLEWLQYEMKASSDDRTLLLLYRA
jgi:serine/threonine protein phosphatase PrpC